MVDTSVWIDHLHKGDAGLVTLLDNAQALTHPFVIGELACGNLKNRQAILKLLNELPQVPVATQSEILDFIERHKLMSRGIGYIDVHLLAATALADISKLWSRDKRLFEIARSMNHAYEFN